MKRKTILITLAIAIIALLAAGGGAFYYYQTQNSANTDPYAQARQNGRQNTTSPETRGGRTDTNRSQPNSPGNENAAATGSTYPVVDTNQTNCYGQSDQVTCGEEYEGQDAEYESLQPSYLDNGDGTVTDRNTGLMWQQDPGGKITYAEAMAGAESFQLAGYNDWRLPTIKELYSLMDFSGEDPGPGSTVENSTPFIDTDSFAFQYGDESAGDRLIDSQWATSTVYEATVMNGQECFFGVNFADGRIKCYPTNNRKTYYTIYVRGGDYGENNFQDNGNGTVTDQATGLTWMQEDTGEGVLWDEALTTCEDLSLAGADDWRLPNIKELQSIVDYTRSPDTTDSPALDPVFQATPMTNEQGKQDYGFYWSSTTHVRAGDFVENAAYISFGRAMGYMEELGGWLDVHGAGAQRSDPKFGVSEKHELGQGPQGDARRSLNYVRCVRGGQTEASTGDAPSTRDRDPAQNTRGNPPEQGERPDQRPGQGGSQGRQPPADAIAACEGKQDNAACTVQTPQGRVNGVCRNVGEDFACVPN